MFARSFPPEPRLTKLGRLLHGISLVLPVLCPSPLYAHVPIYTTENYSLHLAYHVTDPEKSWVTYGRLRGPDDAKWFSFDFVAGDPMVLDLFVSPDSDPDFVPRLAILGPAISPSGELPHGIDPHGLPACVYSGVRSERPEFEPFTPTRLLFILQIDSVAPSSGRYYAVVFSNRGGGKFGLAIGSSESFTPLEWIAIPLSVVGTYLWEGQSLAIVFLPAGVVLALGLLLLLSRMRQNQSDWSSALGVVAGVSFLASAALYTTQVLCKVFSARATEMWLVFVPFIIVSIQVILGVAVIRSASTRRPLRTAIYGLLGWAGHLVGPAIALVSSAAIAARNLAARRSGL
jgi:hypothetical protein